MTARALAALSLLLCALPVAADDAPEGPQAPEPATGSPAPPARAEPTEEPTEEPTTDAAEEPPRVASDEPVATVKASARPAEPEPEPELSDLDQKLLEQGLVGTETIHVRGDDRVTPGSAHTIGREELERFEHDDPHRVLGGVPGVYLREEDGYGLRPNIGMRGSGSERSSKIALMEDGVLIAPAPYSAPAAYYFPLMTRMDRVEVLKGSASVRHGPNTVGGALNLVSSPIPVERVARIDTSVGGDLYGKLHAGAGDSHRHLGYWVEGLKLRSDGFKDLDGGGDTGFDKNDALVKLRVNSNPDHPVYNQLELKLAYSDEVSNETYVGLAQGDLEATPYRRYAGTQLDRMDWRHLTGQLSHRLEVGGAFDVVTTLYRHTFERDWRKLNGFDADRSLATILANPDAGNNAVYYAVLTGQNDSASQSEALLLGTNAREFVSQGVQSAVHTRRRALGIEHELSAGVRLHLDEAVRLHGEDVYTMMGGSLVATGAPTRVHEDSTGSAAAWALFAEDAATFGALTVTAGARAELVSTRWDDRLRPERNGDDFFAVLIPGGGAFYRLTEHLGVLGGVHKGFVPVSPGQDPQVQPEESWNYEAGVRYARSGLRTELIGFFNDYQNLKGSCSFSAGCAEDMVTAEFNGGSVHVRGVEALAEGELDLGRGYWLPLRASYTLNQSSFQSGFRSSNPQWGTVEVGDELPYLPEHQLSIATGVRHERFEIAAASRSVGPMRDAAGQGEASELERVPGYTVLDLAASVGFGDWGRLYATVDNVLDTAYVVSRRPIGARPGKPRLFIAGYKNDF